MPVKIESEIITVEIFEEVIEDVLVTAVADDLNEKCVTDAETFENQCCPGKSYQAQQDHKDCVDKDSGVKVNNKYKNEDDATLTFSITATGNESSKCCANANDKGIENSNGRRRKRAASSSYIDPTIIENSLNSPTVYVFLFMYSQVYFSNCP